MDATVGVDDWPEPDDESQPGKSNTKGNIAIAEARARASRGARRSAQGKYALNVLSPKNVFTILDRQANQLANSGYRFSSCGISCQTSSAFLAVRPMRQFDMGFSLHEHRRRRHASWHGSILKIEPNLHRVVRRSLCQSGERPKAE